MNTPQGKTTAGIPAQPQPEGVEITKHQRIVIEINELGNEISALNRLALELTRGAEVPELREQPPYEMGETSLQGFLDDAPGMLESQRIYLGDLVGFLQNALV